MPELLLELGCEELPATFVRKAYTDLQNNVEEALIVEGISFKCKNEPIGTPRRLIIHLVDLPETQPDQVKESRGPALGGAFDTEGNPTKALQGFCRGQGIEVSNVEKREGYVWVRKTISGRPTIEILAEILPAAIKALAFDKTMRWGANRMRFARPIRWILACFDLKLISFDVEGIQSSLSSRGHRFYSPEEFEVKGYESFLTELMTRKVEPNPKERETTIREVITRIATGIPDLPSALVDENVFLTEWPTPIEGSFKAEYLELPEPVLVTAMAKHEKMFPMRDGKGKILNKFIFVRNSGEDDTVRAGTEWVLNARFNDAKFFFDEDSKFKLADFLAKTEQITFQEKLGTVRQRADRIANLAEWIAGQTGASIEETDFAKTAGLYCKADLSSGLVGELASLQGIVGGEYAKREGFPDEVCWANATQYDLSKNLENDDSRSRTALRVLLADQVDKLAGYLGLGLIPSSSSDPFGLRRAATLCIEATWKRWDIDYAGLLAVAVTMYARQDVELDVEGAKQAAKSIFVGRFESLLEDHRHDIVAAAVMEDYGWKAMNPKQVLYRLSVVEKLAGDVAFIQSASRPLNILKSAKEKGESFHEDEPLKNMCIPDLNSIEAVALADALQIFVKLVAGDNVNPAPNDRVSAVKFLERPINAFFDSTMIMSQDAKEKVSRLSLVKAACDALLTAGDLTKIVIEGV